MTYTVVWLPIALDELAAIWLAANDRNAITAASRRIDMRLSADPIGQSESRNDETKRIIIDVPLQVFARVSESDRMVWVISVAVFGRR
jgi:hypothetical protein